MSHNRKKLSGIGFAAPAQLEPSPSSEDVTSILPRYQSEAQARSLDAGSYELDKEVFEIGRVVRISALNRLADDMTAATDGFLIYCQAKNLSANTVTGYYWPRLQSFRRFLDRQSPGIAPKDITCQLIRTFITDEMERTSASTANHAVTALRAFFNYLVRDGYLETNPMSGIDKLKHPKKLVDALSTDQVQRLLSQFGKSFTDVRDQAIILLMFDCGLRVSETCGLELDDIQWQEQTMSVLGKGSVERIVPFGLAVKQALSQYLTRRGQLETKRVFVNCYGDAVDRFRVAKIVASRCKKAGISGVRCSPHTLRHTFAVSYLRAGGDVFSLQKLLGHASLDMTRRYTQLSQADVIERHRSFSPADRLQPVKRKEGRKRIV